MKKIILSFALVLMCLFTLASCGKKEDPNANVTTTLRLGKSFAGKSLKEDGIEEVELQGLVDGDTTRFKGKVSSFVFTVRYLCIDTPESTQGYDKWGKAASVYNANCLSKAKGIVVESETSTATTDGNNRYLCYVWYIPENGTSYQLLNLELVEEGFTLSGAASSTKYYNYFKKANDKAKANKTRIFGNDEDKYYSEEINNVTLKDLKDNAGNYYDKATSIPKCVAFDAFVISVDESSSGFKTAVVEQTVDGKKYTYNVTVGYSSGASLYSVCYVGMYLHIVGWPDGTGSIHGCKMSTGQETGLWSYAKNLSNFYQIKNTKAEIKDGKVVIKGTYQPVMQEGREVTLTYNGTDIDVSKINGKDVTIFAYCEDVSKPNELTIYCPKAIIK